MEFPIVYSNENSITIISRLQYLLVKNFIKIHSQVRSKDEIEDGRQKIEGPVFFFLKIMRKAEWRHFFDFVQARSQSTSTIGSSFLGDK